MANQKIVATLILLIGTLIFPSASMAKQETVFPMDLQCEHLNRPIGLDAASPRLSWKLKDARQGAKQTAYRLLVSKDSVALVGNKPDSWDTKKINSSNTLLRYAGAKLLPFTRYFWRVEIWDKDGKPAASDISTFETGMLHMANWQGTWIGDGDNINKRPAPYFRKVFDSGNKKIKSARAYLAAAGLYELYLNGQKVGNHRLDPMYTRYDRRNLYVTYDVTAQVLAGQNAIGVLLGNGWYNMQSIAVWNFDTAPWRARPTFCMELRITYEDGSTAIVKTDGDWKTQTGPITFNSIYTAEHYDARLEQKGWNTVDFDDQKWRNVSLRAAPSTNVVSQQMHPIREVESIPAKSLKVFNDTTYVFDLGRNIAGVTAIHVEGPAGTVVRIKHGERLLPDGRVDLSNIDVYHRPKDLTDPFQTDLFILKGEGKEHFKATFNYKGFQYVEVTSNKAIKIDKSGITGYFMHSDVPTAGSINSSSALVNKLWAATNNSYLSNLYGYPTDCPQREKNGWTGDGHFAIESGLYNFDGITIYEKWLADHRDEQQPNGVLPDIIPTGGWGYGTANGTDWTSTIAIIPWQVYLFYGDAKLLEDSYENIKRYVNYVERISPGGLTTFGRGDWVPVKSESPLEYTSSIYYYVDAVILSKAALLFGKEEDQKYYQALADQIKTAINSKYFNAATGIYGNGLQTELSMALQWKIVPEGMEEKVAANLAKRVIADGGHLDVGVLGAKAVLNALSENGQAQAAYNLAVQDTYPSWGWWIVNGATTLYENWNIQAERDISLNHMMFGEIGGWFYKGIGGIRIDESQPGFKNILLKPHFVQGLDHFAATHESPHGKILSSWKRKGKKVMYEVSIPANSTASLHFPLQNGQIAYQKGKKVTEVLELVAGNYQFEIK